MGDTTYVLKGGIRHEYHKRKTEIKQRVKNKISHLAESIIGKASGVRRSQFDDLMAVNRKNYVSKFKNHEYDWNCQRCAPTYEMRRRGFDVEALPFDKTYPHYDHIFDLDPSKYDNYVVPSNPHIYRGWEDVRNPNKFPSNVAKSTDILLSKMKAWGDGSRAVLQVRWAGTRDGHIVNVENINGTIAIVDSQVGQKITGRQEILNYLKNTVVSKSMLTRLDNVEMKAGTESILKRIMKKKGKK